ncbi:histidine kinase [Sphingomonas naphthae]|uniref:Histidine kinase n=1 Tax=Sphingomonas naphthae TaxID=1813468 RepID=A0ABY7TPZ1_9SPHN|nr:histidine kinase [Sphingomonas naphthae]WCT75098.1 histidine kinase [Sphingomonas naphthae]
MTSEAGQALVLTLSVWFLFVYGSYIVSELIAGRTGFVMELPLDVPAVLLVALLAHILYPVAVHVVGKPPAYRWLVMFGASALVSLPQSAINIVENWMLGVIPALDDRYIAMIRHRFGRSFLSHLYMSFANGALLMFLIEARRRQEQGVVLARAELLAARERANALRLQLNPHFLFNTLNSISSLIVTRRPDDADEMISRLSDFLRLSLNGDPSELVALTEEFAALETYLAIETVRFGSRMAVEMELPRALEGAPVPSFILQPLVENAVKYGVARSKGEVTVRIAATEEAGLLVLTIADDGNAAPDAKAAQGFGIGLENIRERLASRYGAAAGLALEQRPDGFTSTVTIPLTPSVIPA